jgi:hypothetical protein
MSDTEDLDGGSMDGEQNPILSAPLPIDELPGFRFLEIGRENARAPSRMTAQAAQSSYQAIIPPDGGVGARSLIHS